MDDQAYLEPDFDPSTLTVPRLRSILVAHNVNYPSSAKKPQLIDLFNENVLPQARNIKAASLRVKRTSRGIENVPGRDEEEEEEIVPAPAKRGRRTTRARTEEAQEVAPTPRSTRHSTAPPESILAAAPKHARGSDADHEPEPKRPASRKSRLSAQTPVVKSERADDESPFSNENIFQSGGSSSPPADRRRTSTSAVKDAERRRSREVRRRTDGAKPTRVQADGVVVPTRKTFEMPVSALKREEVEPTEEFTPEAQQELIRLEQSGELVPTRPRARRPASNAAKLGVSSVLVALLTGLAGLWRQEKINVGYCGVGHASREIAGVEIPEWADIARPQCEPCPPHALCNENLATSCESGFVLTHHPLALNGLVPIPPTCEPDSVKAKKVEQVKEKAVKELREQNARYECGEAPRPEVREPQLKAAISSKRNKRMSNEEFEDLWASAIGEVKDADEITTGIDGSSGHFTLRSTSLASISFACSVRRSLRETLREYFWQLVGILLLVSGGLYGQKAITSGRETDTKAKQLAGLALEKLSYQAALHAAEPEVYMENYIPMAQLRDDVLRDEFSAARRKKLWEVVQRKVENNSNVRPMVREGRSGDVGRVWEWVGAVGLLESPPASGGHNRRKSGRVSFGPDRWIEPSSPAVDGSGSEMSEVKKWEEGRAYY